MHRRWLEMLTVALLGVQFLLTRRLWTGQHAYPRIPCLSLLTAVPPEAENFLLALEILAAGLIVCGWFWPREENAHKDPVSRITRIGWTLLAAGLASQILLNQHCLQVWAWQGLIYAVVFACFPAVESQRALRWLTLSLYFYSAVSKLDLAFLQTYGQTLLGGLTTAIGLAPMEDPQSRFAITLLFPLGELLVAAALAWRRTRLTGLCLSLLMHLGLLLTLGPWGLNHHWPVLVWNLFFLIQNPLLFWESKQIVQGVRDIEIVHSQTAARLNCQRISSSGSDILLAAALLFPATEWWDVADIWPGWGLYSARGARVRLYLPEEVQLPAHLQPFLAAASGTSGWRHLDLHRWSFAELNVPSYPEDRFQLAVALAVLEQLPPDQPFLIQHLSTAYRWTGQRRETFLQTPAEIQQFRQRYWLNLVPRPRFDIRPES